MLKNFERKFPPIICPRCNSKEVGFTYTTGTGYCSKCKSSLIYTIEDGPLALTREGPENGWCHFWASDREWTCKKCKNMNWGPAGCGEVHSICL